MEGADSSEEMGIFNTVYPSFLLTGVVPASYPTSRVSSGASLPPDGTTFRHLGLGEKQTRLIPAYSFWNFQVMRCTLNEGKIEPCQPGACCKRCYVSKRIQECYVCTICAGQMDTSVRWNFIRICETTAAGARTRDRRNSQNKLRRTEVSTWPPQIVYKNFGESYVSYS